MTDRCPECGTTRLPDEHGKCPRCGTQRVPFRKVKVKALVEGPKFGQLFDSLEDGRIDYTTPEGEIVDIMCGAYVIPLPEQHTDQDIHRGFRAVHSYLSGVSFDMPTNTFIGVIHDLLKRGVLEIRTVVFEVDPDVKNPIWWGAPIEGYLTDEPAEYEY